MGQSELIETDVLYVVLSLVLTLPFVKSCGTYVDNSVGKLYGVVGIGQHLTFYTRNCWYSSFSLLLAGKSGMLT